MSPNNFDCEKAANHLNRRVTVVETKLELLSGHVSAVDSKLSDILGVAKWIRNSAVSLASVIGIQGAMAIGSNLNISFGTHPQQPPVHRQLPTEPPRPVERPPVDPALPRQYQ